jgi:CheY-like chemotaxis protein
MGRVWYLLRVLDRTKEPAMKILVVEDTPRHLQEAVRVLTEAGHEVVTATNYDDLHKAYERQEDGPHKPLIDGAISDIYVPLSKARGGGKYNNSFCPVGLLVAADITRSGIPVVFCTDGNHHGDHFQWIDELAHVMGWPLMVDGVMWDGRFVQKDWKKALDLLIQEIAKKG